MNDNKNDSKLDKNAVKALIDSLSSTSDKKKFTGNVKLSDNTKYFVDNNGTWKRLTPKSNKHTKRKKTNK